MRLVVPGYQPGDADRLAELLVRRSGQVSPIFILTWNPQLYLWEEEGQDEAIQVTAAGQVWAQDWSVSRKGGISPGDRAVLYRLNRDRGLVASGTFTSEVHPGPHWDGSGREAMHCDVDWDTVLDFRECLPRQDLTAQIPQVKWGHLQSSGTAVPLPAAPALASLWARHTNTVLFRSPDEPRDQDPQAFPEGALSRVEVNRYERDPQARKTCLEHWGYNCTVCQLSFEEAYGQLGRSYIHVHHLLELSRTPPGYHVNPVNDLRPVCPNCHAMIHRGTGRALTIQELQQLLPRTSCRRSRNSPAGALM